VSKPDLPSNELDRLQALRALRILDTPPEERFDRITSLAARLLRAPKAYISMIDADREWLKSQVGMPPRQTPRELSFCGHVILGDRPMVLPDAAADPRFMDNPLVIGPEGIRSYVGVPLASEDGYNVGALCVADHRVRRFSDEDIQILEDLAALVERELRLADAIRLQQELIETQRALVASQQQLSHELEQAANYVRSRLPELLRGEVTSDWRFIPSQALGGDIFDYYWVDDDHLVAYLVDASGHGVASALLSISVMNLLRAHALLDADVRDPGAVLAALNAAFQMGDHSATYFTIWYGVYNRRGRSLAFATGGHPPAVMLLGGRRPLQKLGRPGLFIGGFADARFEVQEHPMDGPCSLLLFSDGLYEVPAADGSVMGVDEFLDLLHTNGAGPAISLDEILHDVRHVTNGAGFSDDVSILRLDFHQTIE
jgi:sigma-B regulation protein RsbU (phosphoserine phosphatase)